MNPLSQIKEFCGMLGDIAIRGSPQERNFTILFQLACLYHIYHHVCSI